LEAKALDQPITEFLTIINKEFALALGDEQMSTFAALNYHDLAPQLAVFITKQLSQKLDSVDQEQLYKVFKDVYLYHIDTLWIKHLDEMEELRDKVGLVGYAQLDPLVIYKSEAYNKFQTLLYRLKYDVTAYIASLDFSAAQAQNQGATITL
jgi:preprotein translocase subunit SecA